MDRKLSARDLLRWILALGMFSMGIFHLLIPSPFVQVIPKFLPAPQALVLISGLAEMAGAIGLIIAKTRRLAGPGLILLYVAVFPANVEMALHPPTQIPPSLDFLLWLRLPFQALFIYWAWQVSMVK